MTEYPAEFDFDVVLMDGETVRMRPIRPEDAELEARFFARVGPESAYYRFFRAKTELTSEELEYFTNVDYRDRMALVVLHDDEMVAVGRYDVLAEDGRGDETTAEVAFLVEDAFQGRGVGTLLLQQLAAYGRLHDVAAFRAYVLADNKGMLRVLRHSGYDMVRELDHGIYEFEIATAYTEHARQADAEHEKSSTATSLKPLFKPASVAVIGASRDEASVGGRLFQNLLVGGFDGPVYPVNREAEVVRSVKAYPSILDVPGSVDLAFVAVPAQAVLEVAVQCAEKGVRVLVVVSAGFSEVGDEGRRRERQLLDIVRSGGMRMVGPNCIGVLNTDPEVGLNGQFGPAQPPPGNVAMSSQSGALGLAIIDYARELNIGISSFVSVGNKADVSGNDLLMYWEDDPATDVILLYLESFGNPRRFSRLARRIGRSKPIVAVKSGRSGSGARAAASHTGSLANVEVAVDALFAHSGVIRTETLGDLFDVTALLANQPIPQGRRVAVLTNAGGPGILAADALEAQGLVLPELSGALQSALGGHLPPEAATNNPVDMIASAGSAEYRSCLQILLDSNEIDSVIGIYIPTASEAGPSVATAFREVAAAYTGDKPILVVFMRAQGAPRELSSETNRLPVYPYPESAARALGAAVRYGEWRAKPEGTYRAFPDIDHRAVATVLESALERATEGTWLNPGETQQVLTAFGLPMVSGRIATTEEEAVAIARELGEAVAIKVASPTLLHKSDAGGVALGIRGDEEVRKAFRAVTAVTPDADGALIQEYVESGHEVLIGMADDPLFGPLIAFGLGGIYVELMQDVAFRIHPLSDLDATEMVNEVRSARLLEGYRGGQPGDIEALHEALLRVSSLVEHFPQISELDLNPVIVKRPGEGLSIVDARIRIRPIEQAWLPSRQDIPGAHRRRPFNMTGSH